MPATVEKSIKVTGRVVLGPRRVGAKYARIVALVDGSGLIQIYDAATRSWSAAGDACSFGDLWSADPAPVAIALAGGSEAAEA